MINEIQLIFDLFIFIKGSKMFIWKNELKFCIHLFRLLNWETNIFHRNSLKYRQIFDIIYKNQFK